jgi:hypothetical protein
MVFPQRIIRRLKKTLRFQLALRHRRRMARVTYIDVTGTSQHRYRVAEPAVQQQQCRRYRYHRGCGGSEREIDQVVIALAGVGIENQLVA